MTPGAAPALPSTDAFLPPDKVRHPSVVPDPPTKQHVPKQEPGVRPSRALGYRLHVDLHVAATGLEYTISNRGRLGAQLQARSNDVAGAPFSYTVGAGRTLHPRLPASGRFDVSFHGPNGFFRRFAGSTKDPVLEVHARRNSGKLVLRLHNRSGEAVQASVTDAYGPDRTVRVPGHATRKVSVDLARTHGWYDVLVTVEGHPSLKRGLAGRFENGRDGTSDPQLGR